jgi:hypothetical protein
MQSTNTLLDDPALTKTMVEMPAIAKTWLRNNTSFGNNALDAQFQMTQVAGDAWVENVLRLKSGATIKDEEIEGHHKIFIPQPGDKPETIAFKKQLRLDVMEGFNKGRIKSAEQALFEGIIKTREHERQTGIQTEATQAPPMPDWAVNAGITPEWWAENPQAWTASPDEAETP